MYSYGSPHMAAQKQDDQHERTFSSYVRILVVVLKTYLGRWTIGRSGERGSGISVLPARYDYDDDVTLCRWSARQTIPLSVLARNQTKVCTRDLDVTGSWKGTPVREWDKGTEKKELAKGDASGQSTPDSRSDQSAWERVPEKRKKTDQDGLAFLVAL